MQNLPINDVLNTIKKTLNEHNRVVLQAPPGAGKTTAVPLALLNQAWLEGKQIIMLEPRRLAARNAASRMAFLINEKVGETVGYQIRQDNCFGKKTRILVVTEGILTRKLQADPELANTALVIFDEFHERSLHGDLSLALCLQSQQVLNESLKILVMSATLNTQGVAKLLENAPVIESQGRSFPVDDVYLEKPLMQTGNAYNNNQLLINELIRLIKKVISDHQGSCLVFLPGVKEINQLSAKLNKYIKDDKIYNIKIAPLHASLSKQHQDQAIEPPKGDIRKIVLATNIAETSLTIEGIHCVVDSGLQRILEYSPSSAMNTLNTRFISEDSAAQRSGRGGRLAAGVCYRLWTEHQQQRLQKHSEAEILHSDLSSLVLELAKWGVQDVDELQWMDVPPASSVSQAKKILKQLGALDVNNKITLHGSKMLNMGVHPRLAHMMLKSSTLNQHYHACLIASLLTEKDLFTHVADKSTDITDRIKALLEPVTSQKKQFGVDYLQCKRIEQSAKDFLKRLGGFKKGVLEDSVNIEYSGVLLGYAYPDRIAKQRKINEARYLLSNGKGASIPEHLQQHLYEFLVIANLDGRQTNADARIYLSADITQLQLNEYFSELIKVDEDISWNESVQRVEAKITESIGKLVINQKLSVSANRKNVQQCLIAEIYKAGLQCLNWSPQATSLKNRVVFIRHQLASNHINLKKTCIDLPDFSDGYLLNNLSEFLLPHLNNENSLKNCQKINLLTLLEAQLSWDQKQLIDTLAPEKVKVPSGSFIKIDYTDPLQPVLAVRLQEVFGMYESPVILDGECKLMMHLLSPANRPVQVTQDLNSFWKSAYHDVKKELRGKYKRHYWPDDPLVAEATSKTKKNMHK